MKNLTDYFQSLELIKAGVPKESADYYFVNDTPAPVGSAMCQPEFPFVPCWSACALWDFLNTNCEDVYSFDTRLSTEELMDGLVKAACKAMKDVETK